MAKIKNRNLINAIYNFDLKIIHLFSSKSNNSNQLIYLQNIIHRFYKNYLNKLSYTICYRSNN